MEKTGTQFVIASALFALVTVIGSMARGRDDNPLARRALPAPTGRIRQYSAGYRVLAQTVIKAGAMKAVLQGL